MNDPSNREEEVFAAALELPAGERATFLKRATEGDTDLLRRVEELLSAHEVIGGVLDTPAVTGFSDATRAGSPVEPPAESAGTMIGRYKLLKKIGEGGCGVVWLAEQKEPVHRRVALKVIKLGMDTREVIARFEAERQALALMEHPNIAKVFDGGTTGSGRPFFVMELVRGVPITRYCDENNRPMPERLGLFMQVCQAIQHAHQKGIIHRDLKPSNVLVTENDGVAIPKVIDFGIAKATQGRLTDQTLFTAFEQFIGTPAYMSPEQAEMSSVDVDTRSDIYSLGVLLYELLTGQTPFDSKKLVEVGLDEVRRVIREVEPPRPSTRLSTLNETDRATIAKLRGTAPARLSSLLRGDLDWIVMCCLEKDRQRRYGTATALVQDLERFLADEPVQAAGPSPWYVIRKLARKHRTFVFTATAFVFGLVTVAVVSTGIALRAFRLERAEAEARMKAEEISRASQEAVTVSRAVEDFLRVHLLSGDESRARDDTALCDRLDRAAAELRVRPPANPAVEIAVREDLAAGYRSLGLHTSLQEQLARIMELYRAQRGSSDLLTIQASQNLQMALAAEELLPADPISPPAPITIEPPPEQGHRDALPLPSSVAVAPTVSEPPLPAAAPVAGQIVVNLGTLLPRGTTQERLLMRMAESWRNATDGQITLRIFSDGRTGGESEMVTLLRSGRLQASVMTAIGLEDIDTGPVGLQKIPMGFASLEEFDYVSGQVTPMLEERLRRKGLIVLFWSDGGWIQLFSRKPVTTPDDLHNLRLFMSAGRPKHVELMRAVGFNPVPLEAGDLIPAFRSGLLDAGGMPPLAALVYQIDTYAPHMLCLNSEPLVGACVIRRDIWESIPEEVRARLLAIARTTGREMTESARRESDAAVIALKNRGLTVHPVSPEALVEWNALAEKYHPVLRGHIVDPVIFDRVQDLIAEYRAKQSTGIAIP